MATVDPLSGTVEGNSAGTALITSETDNGIRGSAELMVQEAGPTGDLVVEIVGATFRDDLAADVRVLLQDPTTGALLDDRRTDESGRVNEVPDMTVANVSFDSNARRMTWSVSGRGIGDVDFSTASLEWGPLGEHLWEIVVDPTASTVVLPELASDMTEYEPPSEGVLARVEVSDHDNLTGFDGVLSALRAAGGSLLRLSLQAGVIRRAFSSSDSPFNAPDVGPIRGIHR